MKRRFVIIAVLLVALSAVFAMTGNQTLSEENAIERAEIFIKAVNDNAPEKVYDCLIPEIRAMIAKEEFVRNFAKERSYPYLTPLYLYLDHIEFGEDQTRGIIHCIVASRLPGEKMAFEIVFVDGNYYIDAFAAVADGSFIEKFEKL